MTIRMALLGLGWLLVAIPAPAAHDGDINLDDRVDTIDLLWAWQALLARRSLTPDQQAGADIAPLAAGVPDPDGLFNTGDLQVLLRMVLGDLDFALPGNQFNIGDSIGEGEAANGSIGQAHHETVWSTGFDGGDSVNSLNERIESRAGTGYYENNASRDALFNHALSGAEMGGFAAQAQDVVTTTALIPSGAAGMITVFLGSNDVCAPSLAEMTDPALFEAQYRAGLEVLAASEATRRAQIHVAGLPAIYWLWNAKRTSFWCVVFAWPFVPCENLLENPGDDCASSTSREDPDNDYAGDGVNCQRRKQFHRIVRDTYNPILRDVLAEYRDSGALPNARYTDIYDVRFDSAHVNGGDCFHPSTAGHALLAERHWCRTHWGSGDPVCAN